MYSFLLTSEPRQKATQHCSLLCMPLQVGHFPSSPPVRALSLQKRWLFLRAPDPTSQLDQTPGCLCLPSTYALLTCSRPPGVEKPASQGSRVFAVISATHSEGSLTHFLIISRCSFLETCFGTWRFPHRACGVGAAPGCGDPAHRRDSRPCSPGICRLMGEGKKN